jgi:NADH-quinone oxidoreductase subunit J
VRVVTARNPVHGALFLVLAFFTAAALWLLLRAEFLAIVLVVVYVGAVMVLFLFVVMMLDITVEKIRGGFTRYAPIGLLITALMVVELVQVIWFRDGVGTVTAGFQATPEGYSNTGALGAILYTEHAYAFEIAAVILLLAIVAAISLTMRRRPGLKTQDIASQVSVKAADRVRIVKMGSEKRR